MKSNTKITDASSMSQVSRHKPKGKGKRESDNGTYTDQEDDYSRLILKPADQLQLTDQELKEEFTRILTAENPRAPDNLVVFNYKEGAFKPSYSGGHVAVHFSSEGNRIHVDSDEAKKQLLNKSVRVSTGAVERVPSEEKVTEKVDAAEVIVNKDIVDQEADIGDGLIEDVPTSGKTGKKKKLTNQFNFTERATQTYNNIPRDKSTFTEPPPTASLSGNVTQWGIFDAYQEDFEKSEKNKDKKSGSRKEVKKSKTAIMDANNPMEASYMKSAKIIERMVNQNIFNEVMQDFKYYEDMADEFRDPKGTLLPLWSFKSDKLKKFTVTGLCWSAIYFDLFAVSFGSYDHSKQCGGAVAYYSLKNPSYMEQIYYTECGVMCLDIHPKYPHLVIAGLHDGNVAIFDNIRNKNEPIFVSDVKTGKHFEIVWQVKWQPEDFDNNFNFCSISGDGRVLCWTILKNELNCRQIIQLAIDKPDILSNNSNAIPVLLTGSGTAFDFHPTDENLYLVGTEEGKVHVCSKNQCSRYLNTYDAHWGPVYKVAWNLYHPSVFISCSYDWLVKVWDRSIKSKEPLLIFDLGSPVCDVEWSPFSSTVFAAVTVSGKVFVYDLNVNKYENLCEQSIGKKKISKLTHISFNPKHPILLVGDERGAIRSFKLSPNLRKMPKEKKSQDQLKADEKESNRRQSEFEKLDKISIMVRPFEPTNQPAVLAV